jgi:NADH-quinone oxidoreductase subunit L
VPLLGLAFAWAVFLSGRVSIAGWVDSTAGQRLKAFWFSGWGFDRLYDTLLVKPFCGLAALWRKEPVDVLYTAVVTGSRWGHKGLSLLQTGEVRWYAASIVLAVAFLVAIMLRNAT